MPRRAINKVLNQIVSSDLGRLFAQSFLAITVIACAALFVSWLYRSAPTTRIWVCGLALSAALALPMLSWISMRTGTTFMFVDVRSESPLQTSEVDSGPVSLTQYEAIPNLEPKVAPWTERVDWPVLFAGLYGTGVFLGLLRIAVGAIRIRKTIQQSRALTVEELDRLYNLSSMQLSTFGDIRILATDGVPMVASLRGRVLLLPRRCFVALTDAELSQVVKHEAEHIRGGHLALGLLQRITTAVLWPNPFIHWLSRHLTRAEEELCDFAALGDGEATTYARLLVKFAESRNHHPVGGLAPSMLDPRFPLEHRIRGLLDPHRRIQPTMNKITRIAVCAATLTAALLLAGTQIGSAQSAAPPAPPALPPGQATTPSVPPQPAIAREAKVKVGYATKAQRRADRKARRKAARAPRVARVATGAPLPMPAQAPSGVPPQPMVPTGAPRRSAGVPILKDIPIVGQDFRTPRTAVALPGSTSPVTRTPAVAAIPREGAAIPQTSARLAPRPPSGVAAGAARLAPSAPRAQELPGEATAAAAPSMPTGATIAVPGQAVGTTRSRATMVAPAELPKLAPANRKPISVIKNATVIVYSDGSTEIRRPSTSHRSKAKPKSTKPKATR